MLSMVSQEQLRGYILEEVLAHLVNNSGFRLLEDASQDKINLAMQRGDLVVKGRGGYHQADVLGQLEWTPAFTYPLRLFVEAKFRNKTTGIETIRNAISIVLDVNQKSTYHDEDLLLSKYHYVYALFSTSGFTEDAVKMGLAHQISLIDLSSSEYNSLLDSIRNTAQNINKDMGELTNLVYNLRYVLRRKLALSLRRKEYYGEQRSSHDQIRDLIQPVINSAREYGELFIGIPNIPFMLLLKANNRNKFLDYLEKKPSHKVNITWSHYIDNRKTWMIRPSDAPDEYQLTFKLPSILAQRIFGKIDDGMYERAINAKQKYLAHIVIYRTTQRQIQWYRLSYDKEETLRYLQRQRRDI